MGIYEIFDYFHSSKGVYYDVPMPPLGWAANGSYVSYKDFGVLLFSSARVRDYSKKNQQIGVTVNYSHVRAAISLDPSVKWSYNDGDFGFKAVIAKTLTTKVVDYSDALGWDYALDC